MTNILSGIIGKKLIIPDGLVTYKPFSGYLLDSISIADSKYKIYTEINVSCGTCINKISKWDSLSMEFYKYKTPIILICKTEDRFESLKYACETSIIRKFFYPFFLDNNNLYSANNPFMDKGYDLSTVLTDRNNKILMVGNILDSKILKENFIDIIEGSSN